MLIAAPVYRASFPGVLKNLLDITPVEALQNKPVGIVAMGGSPHHYLAVDNQLRQVLEFFIGRVLRDTKIKRDCLATDASTGTHGHAGVSLRLCFVLSESRRWKRCRCRSYRRRLR